MEQVFQQALAHHRAGRYDEAEALFRQTIDWHPLWSLSNLGVIMRIHGRLEEAQEVLREALKIDPNSVGARHTLGMTLLQSGAYAEGWRYYEARHEMYRRPTPPLREWQGESLAGKHILVVAEQGLGDQILWSRFIPLLAERAGRVTYITSPSLVDLFQSLPAHVLYPSSIDAIEADVWASAGSVPRWLEAGPDDAPAPNLPCPAVTRAQGVGLMLGGGGQNANNALRLPGPAVQTAIRGLADFVDLAPEASGASTFGETASIIARLERVVTTDTSVAHLAGALGKPFHLLLPRPAIDWYAGWRSDRTPWYPTARQIRQRTAGDWAGVIGALASALANPP